MVFKSGSKLFQARKAVILKAHSPDVEGGCVYQQNAELVDNPPICTLVKTSWTI